MRYTFAAILCAFIACASTQDPIQTPVLSALDLAPADTSLWTGGSVQLRISGRDSHSQPIAVPAITWQTSDPTIAVVSQAGLITTVAAGSATITARVGSVTTQSVVAVRDRPPGVVSLRLALPSDRYEISQAMTFTAEPLDVDGKVVGDASITWESSAPDIATILPSGYFTAVSAGSATISATSGGARAQAVITIVPQTGTIPDYPNEPAGSRMIVQRGFEAFDEPGWLTGNQLKPPLQGFQIVKDSARGSVGQMLYPGGFVGGYAPGYVEGFLGYQTTTVYTSFWVKYSSEWRNHNTNINKILYFFIDDEAKIFLMGMGENGDPGSALAPSIGVQGLQNYGGSANLRPNLVPTMRLQRDRWYRWEVVLRSNSDGAADGTIDWWINGVKVGSFAGVKVVQDGHPRVWTHSSWHPIWGGAGDLVPRDQFMWMDDLYISGK